MWDSIPYRDAKDVECLSLSLSRWANDPGCGWSRYHPEAGRWRYCYHWKREKLPVGKTPFSVQNFVIKTSWRLTQLILVIVVGGLSLVFAWFSFEQVLIGSLDYLYPFWLAKSNGNRTEWSLIQSVVISDKKIGQPRSGRSICFSRVWLQTELDDTKVWKEKGKFAL